MSEYLCKNYLQFALSAQEREVTIQLAKLMNLYDNHFDIKEIRDKIGITQYSHISAVITRLVQKGVLTRLDRGKYWFVDRELLTYIKKKVKQ